MRDFTFVDDAHGAAVKGAKAKGGMAQASAKGTKAQHADGGSVEGDDDRTTTTSRTTTTTTTRREEEGDVVESAPPAPAKGMGKGKVAINPKKDMVAGDDEQLPMCV